MGRSHVHSNICARLSASAARLQLPEQPAGALLRESAERFFFFVSFAVDSPYGGERRRHSPRAQVYASTTLSTSPIRRRCGAVASPPELCLSLRSSLLSDPSVFYFGFHLFVYLEPLTAPPPQPPFLFLLPANRSAAKNSSAGLLRIYICK